MTNTVRYVVAVLLISQFAFVNNANAYGAYEYGLFCDSCSTQSAFQNFAVANTPKRVGVSVTNVANYNTNQIYVVTIEWERENQVWYSAVTDVRPGNQAMANGLIAAKGLFSPNVYMVTAPTGAGNELFGSWTGSETAAVSNAIASHIGCGQSVAANAFGIRSQPDSTMHHRGLCLSNGDSAQYRLVAQVKPVYAVNHYIEGSRRRLITSQ